MHRFTPQNETAKRNKKKQNRWFKVTFWFPSWRSLNYLKGHVTIPKKVTSRIARNVAFFSQTFAPRVGATSSPTQRIQHLTLELKWRLTGPKLLVKPLRFLFENKNTYNIDVLFIYGMNIRKTYLYIYINVSETTIENSKIGKHSFDESCKGEKEKQLIQSHVDWNIWNIYTSFSIHKKIKWNNIYTPRKINMEYTSGNGKSSSKLTIIFRFYVNHRGLYVQTSPQVRDVSQRKSESAHLHRNPSSEALINRRRFWRDHGPGSTKTVPCLGRLSLPFFVGFLCAVENVFLTVRIVIMVGPLQFNEKNKHPVRGGDG